MTSVLDSTDEPNVDNRRAVLRHRRPSRWMHWINFPLITIMIWSGLRIYWAEDIYALGILDWEWFSFFPDWFNEKLGLERRLARGLAFHLSFGWLFAINGLAYGLYCAKSGEWRHLVPDRDGIRNSVGVVLHDLGIRQDAPNQDGRYNSAQQLSYTIIVALGGLALLTGFAIFKPTQLSLLVTLLGGYETARLIHFWVCLAFVGFFVIHVVQVIRAGRSNFTSMVTGYEVLDPEDDENEDA